MTDLVSPLPSDPQEQVAQLRLTFAALVNPTVARYTELVGSSMVTSLWRDLNDLAQTNHWAIQFSANGLADSQTFEAPEAAIRVYRVMVWTIINHMAIIIGPRLANMLVREAAHQLTPPQQQLIKDYHLVPETALAAPAR